MGLVVGIDLGTQSLKAVVCDESLVVRGQNAVGYSTSYPRPGWAEQDPAAWEAALAPAIAGALAQAGAHARDVGALAITGQLDGCVAVDADGAPVHPALIWQDRRAIDDAERIAAPRLFAITGQIADPGHMAPKIRWLRRATHAARFHQPTSYLVERLAGAAAIDPALASTTMLLELATARWSHALLDAFEITARELPKIHPACAVAGALGTRGAELTGLSAKTPVAVGTGDDFATPLGAGIAAPGPVVCAIGTAEVVGALAASAILDPSEEPMVETHAYPIEDAFFIENPGWLSGGAIRWAVRLLGLDSDAELDRLAASAPPGAGGVTFVPALAGAMAPVWRPHARGTLHGLAAGHGREHIARAVLEGLAFACRDVVERLASIGLAAHEVWILGGGGASRVWAQLRADALHLPHRIAPRPDTSAVGAAMIAAVAAGLVPDLAAAAALAPAPTHTHVPVDGDAFDEAYRRYRTLVAQLAPLAESPWYVDPSPADR